MKTKVFALCMLLVTLLCAVSCNLFNQDDEEEEERTFTVSFYDIQPAKASSYYDEVFLSSQSVEEGKTVSKPADPVDKWGRTFLGWYTGYSSNYYRYDNCFDSEFDFSSSIDSNIKLYGKWKEDLIKVVFQLNGGSTPNSYEKDGYDGKYCIYVINGGNIKAPTPPVRAGDKFIGWYYYSSEERGYKLFDFNMPIEYSYDNHELEAKWVSADTSTYTVSFNSNGGTIVQSQIITSDSALVEPIEPKRDGYNFFGWYTDSNLTEKFDFNNHYKILGDMTLYAKWISTSDSFFVKFESNCTKTVSEQLLVKGEKIEEPEYFAYGTKKGYSFRGWYTDSEFVSKFDFDTPVYAEMTLYAKWIITTPELWLRPSEDLYSADYTETIYLNGRLTTLDKSNSVFVRLRLTDANSYKIYCSKTNDVSTASEVLYTPIAERDYNDTTFIYNIPNFTSGTYYFWIKAFLDDGESAFSNVFTYTKE